MRLLSIHAHPDDESSKGAATTARYAAEGHDVLVLTCTGGERGEVLNPALDRPEVWENMGLVRKAEMEKAAAALGVSHQWLGYVDSGLPTVEPGQDVNDLLPEGCFAKCEDADIAAHIVKVIREFRPHVIVTYDENGGYPHPDHLMVHRASMIAWEKSGDENYRPELGAAWTPLKLYYSHGFLFERLQKYHDYVVAQGKPSPFAQMLSFGDSTFKKISERVTTEIDCGAYFEQRARALMAHATQIDPAGPFLVVPVDVQQKLWPTEEFELAASRVRTTLPENDLFAGIAEVEQA